MLWAVLGNDQKAVSSAKQPILIKFWNFILKSFVKRMLRIGEREDP